jgi:hypothetical protein
MPQRIATFLLLGLMIACGPSKDIEPLYRASKAVQVAVTNGVTFTQYRDLVGALATEESLATARFTTGRNAEIVAGFSAYLRLHQDALLAFRMKTDSGSNDYFAGRYPPLDDMFKKYDQRAETVTILDEPIQMYSFDRLLQRIWQEGSETLSNSEKRYLGR